MKRALFINILCAFVLFFLLLTGEEALLSQKVSQQDNASSELVTEYLVLQHQLKATLVVKEINLSETNLTRSFLGSDSALLTSNWWRYLKNNDNLLQQRRYILDKRKAISLLLYPYHDFW